MSLEVEKKPSTVQKLIDTLDHNTRAVKLGVYSVALVGLAVAVRRVRPFTQFKRPKDVPKHFIIERRELVGRVNSIEPSNALLMVEHEPLVNLPFRSSGSLPVKVSGVNVTSNGISWLQAIASNSDIKFIPVLKEANWLECEVFIVQQNKPEVINIAESLLAIGFGSLQEGKKELINPRYYKKLKVAENFAIRKRMGYKYYIISTSDILLKMGKTLYNFIFSKTPKSVKTSKVVVT